MKPVRQESRQEHKEVEGLHVLLSICGSIGALAAPALLSRIHQEGGLKTRVVVTEAATRILSLEALQRKFPATPVISHWRDVPDRGAPHVALAKWADVMIIAPATANTLAKLAHGITDNLVTSAALGVKDPLIIAPAMSVDMWRNRATQRNVATLRDDGHHLIEPQLGFSITTGETNIGVMASPEDIMSTALSTLVHRLV
jgi:phosphopantothenoylcysteine decarboxylase/phosphopantothenate--cysteine ligase